MKKTYENILVIKLSVIRDFLLSLSAMKEIRGAHPEARITLLTTQPFVKMAKSSGYFDKVIVDKRLRLKDNISDYRSIKSLLSEYKRLRHRMADFDLVVDFDNNDRTHTYYWALYPFKKPAWSGYIPFSKHCISFSHRKYKGASGFSSMPRLHNQLKKLGIHKEVEPNLEWMSADIKRFDLPKKYAMIIPGLSHPRIEERWSSVSYGRLANILTSKGYVPVVIGEGHDADFNKEIARLCPDAVDLTNHTSMADLVEIGRNAKVCVAADTGPSLAVSLTECPTLFLDFRKNLHEDHFPDSVKAAHIQKTHPDELTVDEVVKKLETIGYLK